MKLAQQMAVAAGWLLAGALGLTAADDLAARYNAIAERNAFGLRAPVVAPPPEPPPPTITVKMTGITTLMGNKRALLVITEQGKPAESKMIRQGDREGQIEVLEIDEVGGSVKIKNGDREMTLTFEKDGIKPPTGPAVPMPGAPPVPGGIPGMPGLIRNPSIPGMPTAGMPNMPGVPGMSLPPSASGLARPIRVP